MELVYGDCVALYPHMSEKIGTNGYNTAKHVATDILYAENPLYQLTDGVYYENDDVVAGEALRQRDQADRKQYIPDHLSMGGAGGRFG